MVVRVLNSAHALAVRLWPLTPAPAPVDKTCPDETSAMPREKSQAQAHSGSGLVPTLPYQDRNLPHTATPPTLAVEHCGVRMRHCSSVVEGVAPALAPPCLWRVSSAHPHSIPCDMPAGCPGPDSSDSGAWRFFPLVGGPSSPLATSVFTYVLISFALA